MKVTLENGDFGSYLLTCEDGRDILIQVDYDYPGVASNLGWSLTHLQKDSVEFEVWDGKHFGANSDTQEVVCAGSLQVCQTFIRMAVDTDRFHISPIESLDDFCPHDSTDGTIDCPCGMKAMDFITSAQEWLDDHIGEEFEDPGYFTEEE